MLQKPWPASRALTSAQAATGSGPYLLTLHLPAATPTLDPTAATLPSILTVGAEVPMGDLIVYIDMKCVCEHVAGSV